jgi:hypothetical protein
VIKGVVVVVVVEKVVVVMKMEKGEYWGREGKG